MQYVMKKKRFSMQKIDDYQLQNLYLNKKIFE